MSQESTTSTVPDGSTTSSSSSSSVAKSGGGAEVVIKSAVKRTSSPTKDGPAVSKVDEKSGHLITIDYRGEEIDDGSFCSRPHKTSCCPGLCPPCNWLFNPCRKCVSGSKRRIIIDDEGFNLDLTYLNDRIIVHGFPADGLEHAYRNPRYEMARFLDLKHKDNYLLYNFCCEPGRGYRPEIFHGRVERYPFKDHNIPPLDTVLAFANSTKRWLDADPKNVVSMHCKAGKGRAGLMSCITLFRNGYFRTAKECMEHYDRTRVTNNKGLTVPSQRKVVIFYESLWRDIWNYKGNVGDVPADNKYKLPELPTISIHAVEVMKVDPKILKGCRVKVYKGTNTSPELLAEVSNTDNTLSFQFPNDIKITGNFKIVVECGITWKLKAKKPIELWHNTLFMEKGSGFIDFSCQADTLYALDTTKDFKKKCNGEVVLRVHLGAAVASSRPFTTTGTETSKHNSKGYEMVPVNDVEVTLGDSKP